VAEHGFAPVSPFTGAAALEAADTIALDVPRGEPRRAIAAVADALASREPAETLRQRLSEAADALDIPGVDLPGDEEVRLALAWRLALPYLARDESMKEALADVEPLLEGMDADERVLRGPALARAAAPAIAVDLELLKDEGYRYVETYPPAGSEGVDVVGMAATWLTKRMTVDGDDARLAMRRFLAVLAEEVEVELPLTAATIDALLAVPAPLHPFKDELFLALARGLVEEAIEERGFPW
jgi:hypothetical protein